MTDTGKIMVSIPPWFDFAQCCRGRTSRYRAAFQSHLGSILPCRPRGQSAPNHKFQSHLGSILPLRERDVAFKHRVFQSHLGSILPGAALCGGAQCCRFQSHLGSILPAREGARVHGVSLFQSHLGSILPRCRISMPIPRRCFNPTLVRFCRVSRTSFAVTIPVSIPPWFDFAESRALRAGRLRQFQSHLGSILPRARRHSAGVCGRFQSHLGSILPYVRVLKEIRAVCFNPTLVRFCPPPAPARGR